jgi:thiol-disulfide isomerase/thioredoxin
VIGPFTLTHLVMLGVVLVGAAVLLAVLRVPLEAPGSSRALDPGAGFYQVDEPTTGLVVGQRAPELQGLVDGALEPLRDLEGGVVSLADHRGQPVWLNFFATWCPPCQEEVPVLREAYQRYTIGFDATSAVFRTYAGFGLPTHVFIDADGVVRHVQYGPLDLDQVATIVEPLLGQPGPGGAG